MTKINKVQTLVIKKLAGEEVFNDESDVESKFSHQFHNLDEDDWINSTQQVGNDNTSPKKFNKTKDS